MMTTRSYDADDIAYSKVNVGRGICMPDIFVLDEREPCQLRQMWVCICVFLFNEREWRESKHQ
jgi:hypothetical protein